MADNGKSGGSFMAFVMGAVIGGGLALLYAPRSGELTRAKIRQMADDASERFQDLIDESEEQIKKTVEESKSVLRERKEALRMAAEAGKSAYQDRKAAVEAAAEAGQEAFAAELDKQKADF
jgi:gas vesicle protein